MSLNYKMKEEKLKRVKKSGKSSEKAYYTYTRCVLARAATETAVLPTIQLALICKVSDGTFS